MAFSIDMFSAKPVYSHTVSMTLLRFKALCILSITNFCNLPGWQWHWL